MWRPGTSVLIVALFLVGTVCAEEPPMVRYEDGRLSVRLEQVPLDLVLSTLAEETGATIRGHVLEPREVTKHFDDVPIARAIDRLLGRQNFTLRFAPDGSLAAIHLEGMPAPRTASPARRTPAPRANFQKRVALTGTLRAALGRPQVPLAQLIAAAGRQEDARVRGEAARLAVTTIEADAQLREAVLAMSDAALAGLLRSRAGARASEVAAAMMGAARTFQLRAKAARVMQQIRQPSVKGAPRVG